MVNFSVFSLFRDLYRHNPRLLPHDTIRSSGAQVSPPARFTKLNRALPEMTISLHERLLVGRGLAMDLSDLHSRGFWCGQVTMEDIFRNYETGVFHLRSYCVPHAGLSLRELIAKDIHDLGLSTPFEKSADRPHY
jgi:hypothetical protein